MPPAVFDRLTGRLHISWGSISPTVAAAALGSLWSLACVAVGAGTLQRYFASRDSVCPPTADLAAFCRANLVDTLAVDLRHVGLALVLGLLLTAVAVGVTSFMERRL